MVVWACERFHLYLTGLQSFQLVTDYKAVEAIYGPTVGLNHQPELRGGSCV